MIIFSYYKIELYYINWLIVKELCGSKFASIIKHFMSFHLIIGKNSFRDEGGVFKSILPNI
jgi:hypothetical protein